MISNHEIFFSDTSGLISADIRPKVYDILLTAHLKTNLSISDLTEADTRMQNKVDAISNL